MICVIAVKGGELSDHCCSQCKANEDENDGVKSYMVK